MPRLLSCGRGHWWHEPGGEDTVGTSTSCPVCGESNSSSESSVSGPLHNSGTLLTPSSWEPIAPALVQNGDWPRLLGFELVAELGRGGMGVVYQARRVGRESFVALKVIRPDRLAHAEAVRRFRREAEAAARLDHPNIVRILDSDHSGDTHYLVMEFVDGIALDRLIELRGPLPVAQACDFIRQAALGLQHAHDQLLVHRDIKPSNLMATPLPSQTEPTVIKLLDLGVARVLQLAGGPAPGESLSTLTQGGAVIGTADYVAPEQLEDPHHADVRADLYSLGCTFYFLLTGHVPFPGGSLVSKLDKQRWQAPEAIEAVRTDVPAAVSAVVSKLMAKKPADRYQSPEDVAQVLADLAETGYHGRPRPVFRAEETRCFAGHRETVRCVSFTPDGERLVSAGGDGKVVLWEVATGHQKVVIPGSQEVRALAFNPAGDRLATAAGLTLRLWELGTGRELRRFNGHTGTIKAIAFSADGEWVISGGDDKTVRVWDVTGGREIMRLTPHTGGITCLAAGMRNHLCSGSRDKTVRLWDLRAGQEARVLSALAGAVLDVAVGPEDRHVVSAHFDTVLRLWDFTTGRELRRFIGHKQMVTAVAFTPDGRRLLSGSHDQTVRMWDVGNAEELASWQSQAGPINTLAVDPTGCHIAAAGGDGVVCLIRLPS